MNGQTQSQWTPEQLEKGGRMMELVRQSRDAHLVKTRMSSSQAKTEPSEPATKSAN